MKWFFWFAVKSASPIIPIMPVLICHAGAVMRHQNIRIDESRRLAIVKTGHLCGVSEHTLSFDQIVEVKISENLGTNLACGIKILTIELNRATMGELRSNR